LSIENWATLQEAGVEDSTALDFLALSAILFCPLHNRFCLSEPAVAASIHLYEDRRYLSRIWYKTDISTILGVTLSA
jgi:hypothetical protein